jgi:hypothetical protein
MADPCHQPVHPDSDSGRREMGGALEALLPDVLACLRRRHSMPLQDDDEGLPISAATFHALASKHFPQPWKSQLNGVDLRSALDRLVDQLLVVGQPSMAGDCSGAPLISADDSPQARPEAGKEIETALSAWLESLWTSLREVHPKAIEVLALRREGFQEREVSERLMLPLRLVRRIVDDTRAAWQRRDL